MKFLDYISINSKPTHLSRSKKSNLVYSREEAFKALNSSSVVQFVDDDGIVKIAKKLTRCSDELSKFFDYEDFVLASLYDVDGVPRIEQAIRLNKDLDTVMIMSYLYGQSYDFYAGNIFELCRIFVQLFETLGSIHKAGVIHGDIRPENIIADIHRSNIIDFDFARFVTTNAFVSVFPSSALYSTPEGVCDGYACYQSDFFQLTLVFYIMLTGKHPYLGDFSTILTERELFVEIEKSFKKAEINFDDLQKVLEKYPVLFENLKNIFSVFLQIEPKDRVIDIKCHDSFVAIKESLASRKITMDDAVFNNKLVPEKQIVLFPARMAMPHKGHIEYITRLIDLGFHVRISLQRSYVINDEDPMHKWIVMKIVARALMLRGYSTKDFSFMLTPFFETALHMGYHFMLMPDSRSIKYIASGNDGVYKYFAGKKIIDQKAVFGTSGENYEMRSWGSLLRSAVVNHDTENFKKLYALDYHDTEFGYDYISQAVMTKKDIEFIPGAVFCDFSGCGLEEISRVPRYSFLYDFIASKMSESFHGEVNIADLSHRYAKFSNPSGSFNCDVVESDFDGNNLYLRLGLV